MSNILTIGYIGEGTTDQRFLGNIIQRTFETIALDCRGQIEVYEPQFIKISNQNFVNQVIDAARKAKWLNVLCIHTDADSTSNKIAFENKITPAIEALNKIQENICKNIVPIIPVHMTEAWLLADIDELIQELGTNKSKKELGLPAKFNQIENIVDPKELIKTAIINAYQGQPARRRKITISDLYSPLSQKVSIALLENLPSFKEFKCAATNALKILNYMD